LSINDFIAKLSEFCEQVEYRFVEVIPNQRQFKRKIYGSVFQRAFKSRFRL